MKTYGELTLTDSSPAQVFTEPMTVDDVKTFLRISNDLEDGMIAGMISAARESAEILQNRDLIVKQYDLSLDLLLGYDAFAGAANPLRFNSVYNFGPGYEITLRSPLRSVDLFQYTDNTNLTTTMVENTDYIVDKRRHLVTPPWGQVWPFFIPRPSSAVLIRFTSGMLPANPFWKDAGTRVLQGMKFLIAGWYENRIPYGDRRGQIDEYPWTITDLLSYGHRPRVF